MEPDAQRRRMLGRTAGWLFLLGSAASVPAHALLGDTVTRDYVVNAIAGVLGLICILTPWHRMGPVWLHVIATVATGMVALSVWSGQGSGDIFAWDYLLIAVFVGYAFESRGAGIAHLIGLVAAMWLPALLAGHGYPSGEDSAVRALVGGPMLLISGGVVIALRERLQAEQRQLREVAERAGIQAVTDALTGLHNRRRLLVDLEEVLATGAPRRLALFDLNGFKAYNDAFGHLAGDALLRRLGLALQAAVAPAGAAYRLGGDEFCALLPVGPAGAALVEAAHAALSEVGDVFVIDAAGGAADVPFEATTVAGAMGLADERMYAGKNGRGVSAANQSSEVLMRVLAERHPEAGHHLHEVAALAQATARALGMHAEEVDEVVRAAQLHDVGKAAIPDAILEKPGPLDAEEWRFMRHHTLIGERILHGAPSLGPVARLVRASHERPDGQGYPDGLVGDAIPLGARVVAVCDAYHAMIDAARPYREPRTADEALAELDRCAGTQFDPQVVAAFHGVVASERLPAG